VIQAEETESVVEKPRVYQRDGYLTVDFSFDESPKYFSTPFGTYYFPGRRVFKMFNAPKAMSIRKLLESGPDFYRYVGYYFTSNSRIHRVVGERWERMCSFVAVIDYETFLGAEFYLIDTSSMIEVNYYPSWDEVEEFIQHVPVDYREFLSFRYFPPGSNTKPVPHRHRVSY
jgi:hypothetical protein